MTPPPKSTSTYKPPKLTANEAARGDEQLNYTVQPTHRGCWRLATLQPARRIFVTMPLMHAEAFGDQQLCVRALKQLLDELALAGPPAAAMQPAAAVELRAAVEHRDIIARFGRFPHRNRALGRECTAEEQQFLHTAQTYGQ